MTERPLTFDPAFGKLGREITRFANHTRKLVQASQKHRKTLEKASEWTQGTAPLDRRPTSAAAALRAIDKFARIHRADRPTLFGAYFAHHHLRMQAELSRMLLRESFGAGDLEARIRTAHAVYDQASRDRREWISALLECSIAAAAPDLSPDDFAVMNVGALTDHEDVDLAIVVSSLEAREQFGHGFSTVSKVFLRFASKIQLFVTEYLSAARAGGLIEEYEEILQRPKRSVVIVMQLLGAQLLAGSRSLAMHFGDRLTRRYYADGGDPHAHESFLRAVMGELKHYQNLERISEILVPKREIYIPTKLVTAAARAIHCVHEPSPPAALQILAERHPAKRASYLALADAFVQNEVLRALMFLYVVKTDEIDLYDPSIQAAARRVGVLLGLGASARRSAETRLLAAYKDIRARALGALFELSFEITRYLRKTSTLRQIIERGREISGTHANMALRLLNALKRNKTEIYWGEVVELVSGARELVQRFLLDLGALGEEHARSVARELLRMVASDAASLVEMMVFLAAYERDEAQTGDPRRGTPYAKLFWEAMINVLASDVILLDAFTSRLDEEAEAEALFRLANSFPPEAVAQLAELVLSRDKTTRGERVVRALRSAIVLVHHQSNALGRIADRVISRTPEFIMRMSDAERLRSLARDLLTQAAREQRPKEQIELLGDAFDVEAVRTAMMAILEGAPADSDKEFVAAFDVYVRELFKACFREIHDRSPIFENYRPGSGFALYATGGFGRGEGFGADWDYLAVVDEDDPGRKKFFGKVLQRLGAAMARRGTIPHNRLTDHFNSYVVSVPELARYLGARTSETFIDEAEVVEARFILGDPAVRRAFETDIFDLVTKTHATEFIRDLLRELRDRRKAPPLGLNLKLGPGGLREIHLLWLAIRIFAKLPGPFSEKLLPEAIHALPAHSGDLRFLLVANTELRRIRDLYRLVVAIDDPMDSAAFVRLAKDLPPLRDAGAREDMEEEILKLMRATAIRVDRIAAKIAAQMKLTGDTA